MIVLLEDIFLSTLFRRDPGSARRRRILSPSFVGSYAQRRYTSVISLSPSTASGRPQVAPWLRGTEFNYQWETEAPFFALRARWSWLRRSKSSTRLL
jgi:hypothetical protein